MTTDSRQTLVDIISDFAPEKFSRFFREKSRQFAPRQDDLSYHNDDGFAAAQKLGEIKFSDGDQLLVCAFAAQKPLSERSGKKAQYDKAKKILQNLQNFSAGIFVFYDAAGNFRFSLVYPESTGAKRQWNNFRRFTYFVSADPEVTNKTYLQRIGDGDFSTLQKIKEAFSVEKVTKEFYEAIANWYFWALDYSRFPKDAEAEDNGRNISVIRLITRIIFIWFMRERGLVPKALFDEKSIPAILKDISPSESTYYKAILQNLFFATLSTKKAARQLRSETRGYKGYNPDFGNQYVYRYHELFQQPENIKDYFAEIPFLNGGLFECLDDKATDFYIDGFTATKKNQPEIPNLLFFSAEKKADLNKHFGTKDKKYKVRGLFDILSSFNFTIDENTADDQEVALDPELLGRVFENLLASITPETATTARKATGSYYTPRQIVDYMVQESLKTYFKTHLSGIADVETKLEQLFSVGSTENPFNSEESKTIVNLIESVKIVDPAVGSGAFPMGALNKLVFILNKVDAGNELWKQAQLFVVEAMPDASLRRETRNRIEEFFQGKNADYGRKLYLIQKCIYGVDIQQIAVEIAKLRFFISLLVDEKIDKTKDNWGIEPLPNLDFKIMQGNSLISSFMGIDFDNGQEKHDGQGQVVLDFIKEDDALIKAFEQKKFDFQSEAAADKKGKLKKEIEDLLIKIFETIIKKQKADYFKEMAAIERRNSVFPNKQTREEMIAKDKHKLSQRMNFDLEGIEKQLREFTSKKKTRPFFPWKLYFAEVFEKGGFDVVIGNPPYVFAREARFTNEFKEQIKNIYLDKLGKKEKKSLANQSGKINLFSIFIIKGLWLLKENSIVTYILPNNILRTTVYDSVRKYILNNSIIKEVVDLGSGVFKNVTASTVLLSLINKNPQNIPNCIVKVITEINDLERREFVSSTIEQSNFLANTSYTINILVDENTDSINKKLKAINSHLGDYCKYISPGIDGDKEKYVASKKLNSKYRPLLFGKDFGRYVTNYKGHFILYDRAFLNRARQEEIFLSNKIILQRISGGSNPLTATIDLEQHYTFNSVNNIVLNNEKLSLKVFLAILNSKIINWYYANNYSNNSELTVNISKTFLEQLPIAYPHGSEKSFDRIVDYILYNKKEIKDSAFFESLIDAMVYELYLPDEIKAADCEVLKHLTNLPELKEGWGAEQKLQTIEKAYKELSNPNHPVSIAMFKMDTIEEIRIIEGKH